MKISESFTTPTTQSWHILYYHDTVMIHSVSVSISYLIAITSIFHVMQEGNMCLFDKSLWRLFNSDISQTQVYYAFEPVIRLPENTQPSVPVDEVMLFRSTCL